MLNSLRDQYTIKKVKLDDGEYLDIDINFPKTKNPASQSRETDIKYLKCFLTEASLTSKFLENKKDVDNKFMIFLNFHYLSKLLFPTFVYSLFIIYKKQMKGKINTQASIKENLKPRLRGLGITFLAFLCGNLVYTFFNKGVTQIRLDFLNELFGDDKSLNLEGYENFKLNYFQELNKNENI